MLWHRLGLELGSTIADLKARMTMSEFSSWVAYDRLVGVGKENESILLAKIVSAIHGSCGVKTSVYDVAPWLDTRTDEQKKSEKIKHMLQQMNSFTQSANAKV